MTPEKRCEIRRAAAVILLVPGWLLRFSVPAPRAIRRATFIG
jgi:hypothetical protein